MKRSTPHNLMNSELSALRFLFVSCAVVKVYVWAVNSFLEKRRWNSCQSLRHTLPSGLHMPESVKKETGHFLSITPFAERISNRSSDTLRAGGDIDSLSCILGFLISYSCIRKRFSECHIDGRPFAPLSPKIFHLLPAPPQAASLWGRWLRCCSRKRCSSWRRSVEASRRCSRTTTKSSKVLLGRKPSLDVEAAGCNFCKEYIFYIC